MLSDSSKSAFKMASEDPRKLSGFFRDLQGLKSRFIGPCKSWTDARFGITQFVTPNTHVFRHPGV